MDVKDLKLRPITEAELATIARIVLLWGSHEQDVGTIVSVGLEIPKAASAALVQALGYGRKVDLACGVLRAHRKRDLSSLAQDLAFVKQSLRPERDTLVHGAFGLWTDDAWVRNLSKDRFVSFDDLRDVYRRAEFARYVSQEACYQLQDFNSGRLHPGRPAPPIDSIPSGWHGS